MRLLIKYLLALVFVCSFTNAYSDGGILIFEISDAQNKPVTDLQVEVKKEGEIYKTYTTNESGRVVELSLPSGKYSYSFAFGDWHEDQFTVKDGDYTWINLDYRSWSFSFKDEDGNVLEGKKATIYKVNKDRTETLVSEKFSNEAGVVEFLVPEGDYRYATFRGTNYVTVKDENINTAISVTSGEITHQTQFSFINDKREPMTIFAKDILVTHIAPDSVYPFGSVDAHSEHVSHGYYEYNTTENHVSCPDGTYTCSVETRDYGTLTDTFVVDENDPLIGNIVYLVLPTLPTQPGEGDDDEKNKENLVETVDTITPGTPYRLDIIVRLASDMKTPVPDALTNLLLSEDHTKRSVYGFTNDTGLISWYVAPSTYDIAVLNDTLKDVTVESDTTVYLYIDPKNITKIYFDFYYADKRFNPSSISSISTWSWAVENLQIEMYGRWNSEEETYSYDRPLLLPHGIYSTSFFIDEKDYHKREYKTFEVEEGDTAIHVETKLLPFYTVNIVMTDINGKDFESRQYVEMVEKGYSSKLVTDSTGHFSEKFLIGEYDYIALGDTQHVVLNADTTLYFQSKSLATQKVKFQFLHDGQLVYPQIMNMDVKLKQNDMPYSKTISHFYPEYEGHENVWVFDESTICEMNEYYVEYVLKDYDYNGTFQLDFKITNSVNEDTLIYIVVPVKRSVTITIKDANLDLVTGVFANIYKYDKNGVLGEDTQYDNGNHEGIRTNTAGQVIDHLVPGRYQLRILDIVRDFIVKDYDLSFDIISGTKLYDVKYVVLYNSSKSPAENLMLDVTKDGAFYNTTYTDEEGVVELFSEAGNYAYHLHYAEGHDGSFNLKKDTTIYIYIEDPVLVDSMNILGCACMAHNDTLRMNLFQSPANATVKEVEWSIDNEILAHISSEGELITNNVLTDGFVTVTVRSTDGSGVEAKKKFYISNDNCGPAVQLSYSHTSAKDIPLEADTVGLKVTFSSEDEFDHAYIYQFSVDSVNWTSLYGPTEQTEVVVPAVQFNKDVIIRVLSATSEADVVKFAENMDDDCGSNKVSNVLSLRINHLTPIQWPDSICATTKEITLKVSEEELGNLAEGYKLAWYEKPSKADTFLHLNSDGEFAITVAIDSTTTYKAVVEKEGEVSAFVQQTVFVEQVLDYHMVVSKDTACLGDTVVFSAEVTSGEAGDYLWNDGSSDVTAAMLVDNILYTLKVTPKYKICPAHLDTMNLVVDVPVDFELSADRTNMCVSDTAGIRIQIDTLSSTLGNVLWNTTSTEGMIHVVPGKDTIYSVVVSSPFERCPVVRKEMAVKVNELLSVSIDADNVDLCQYGNDSILLTAQVTSGEVKEYVWWNGQRTTENTMSFIPQESVAPWVAISDGICPDSDKDSLDIRVAIPSSVAISSTNKVFEYRSDINLVATTTSPVYGPYTWYSIDADGDEYNLKATEESTTSDLPTGDISYYVLVENGACPEIVSDTISMHLMDNIVIPTIFTPYVADGQNDDFMPGYPVIIYDRYGDIVCNSNNGWDGNYRGKLADPGVYYYVLTLKDERVVKGTIELFRK